VPLEDDDLIALDADGFVDRLGVEALSAEVSFCPGDKECRCSMNLVEAGKIQVATIHDVDGPYLDDQLVEDVYIVDLSRGNDHHGRNVPMQIQKDMEFYCPFVFPELGPREKGQTEVDSGRIQGIDRLIQLDAKGIGGVKLSGFHDKNLSEVGINPPVSGLIGMREGIAGDLPSDAQMIKSGLDCP